MKVLVRGIGASPGIAAGVVRVCPDPVAATEKVGPGDVLVVAMTDPAFVPAMGRAAAIVTSSGGLLSHAAIVARELGIPAVVGTRRATTLLRDGARVTVDGLKGLVYEG